MRPGSPGKLQRLVTGRRIVDRQARAFEVRTKESAIARIVPDEEDRTHRPTLLSSPCAAPGRRRGGLDPSLPEMASRPISPGGMPYV